MYAVVIAKVGSQAFYPLDDIPSPLLPVVGKPLLSYPLRMLEGSKAQAILVVIGEPSQSAKVAEWASKEFGTRMRLEVVQLPEETGTAQALKAVASKIKSEDFVCLSGDLITDLSLPSLLATHKAHGTMATVIAVQRKSPSADGKPGKAPKGVEYVGLDGERLVLYAAANGSDVALKTLHVPPTLLRSLSSFSIRTDLQDASLYIFHRSVLDLLETKPGLVNLKRDLLPLVTSLSHQDSKPKLVDPAPTLQASLISDRGALGDLSRTLGPEGDVTNNTFAQLIQDMSHTTPSRPSDRLAISGSDECSSPSVCRLFSVPSSRLCVPVQSLATYAEVNKDLLLPEKAVRFPEQFQVNAKYENIVHGTVVVGGKSTVGPGCFIGEGSHVGEKVSIKRSVIGAHCRIGDNVKITNSVILEGCVIESGVNLQNCVVGGGCRFGDKSSLKDCQVGPGKSIGAGETHKDDAL